MRVRAKRFAIGAKTYIYNDDDDGGVGGAGGGGACDPVQCTPPYIHHCKCKTMYFFFSLLVQNESRI